MRLAKIVGRVAIAPLLGHKQCVRVRVVKTVKEVARARVKGAENVEIRYAVQAEKDSMT